MNIAIISFPGSNCERETALAIKRVGMNPIEILWNQLDDSLDQYAGFIIIGGFSYEDRGRAGLLAALDPCMSLLSRQAELGKPILGICNGAQILVESGLVPGMANHQLGMALTLNKRMANNHVIGTGYYNDWVYLKTKQPDNNAFMRYLKPEQPLYVPIAHAEGRFVIPPKLLAEIHASPASILYYCDADGNIDPQFPINPNGSIDNIAGISNYRGNVMALMPHPERCCAGDTIFASMRDYISENQYPTPQRFSYQYNAKPLATYQPDPQNIEFCVDTIITDNTAVSVNNTLTQLGLNAHLTRQTHWEIATNTKKRAPLRQAIIDSCELFNPNKEMLVEPPTSTTTTTILVRDQEDFAGMHIHDILHKHFNLAEITAVTKGTLWQIHSDPANHDQVVAAILAKHVLFNPYAHEYFHYQTTN